MSINHGAQQGTVTRDVCFAGPGLHSGRQCRATVKKAPVGHGIVFRHLDKKGREKLIRADWRNVRDLPLCTCLTDGSRSQVRTVEHLLGALFACGIDNAIIEVEGDEIPLLDGSAKPFVDALSHAVTVQNAPRKVTKILKWLNLEDGPRWIKIRPSTTFHIEIQTYVEPFGRLPWWRSDITRPFFTKEIAPARTFGSLREGLLAKTLTWMLPDPVCLGADTSNAVVISRGRVITPGGLRFPDEFARHRALDLIGDLMLAGTDFQARFVCFSPTHRLTRKALEAIFSDPSLYETMDNRTATSVS
jgi:UDP-3-O-[3-hydroxymyristoyl] N-acetylglucosamine deacetylase